MRSAHDIKKIVGVDEADRGPLAGIRGQPYFVYFSYFGS